MREESPGQTGIYCEFPELQQRVTSISRRFGITIITRIPSAAHYLYLDNSGLQLRHSGDRSRGPVMIDFTAGTMDHRRRFGGGRGQPLARAVGMKPGVSPHIFDATAGLGRDAFVFASCGCRVSLCERAPVLAALLDDALLRAASDAEIGDWISQRMQLLVGDSAQLLQTSAGPNPPQVIYLDPMYPQNRGNALVKKEMQALQQLLGPDTDSANLFRIALSKASHRVVVKRPRRAGWLENLKPSASIESKKTRYDIYMRH